MLGTPPGIPSPADAGMGLPPELMALIAQLANQGGAPMPGMMSGMGPPPVMPMGPPPTPPLMQSPPMAPPLAQGMPPLSLPPEMPPELLDPSMDLGPEYTGVVPDLDDTKFVLPDDPAEMMLLVEQAIGLWRPRDERMDEDQRLWELHKPKRRKNRQSVSVNDNAVQIDKLATILAKAEIIPEFAAGTDDDRTATQKIEDACDYVLAEWAERHVSEGRSPMRHEAGTYAGLRGWLASLVLLDTDDAGFPWTLCLLDPRQIYPDSEDGKPCFVVHRYSSTQRKLEYEFGKEAVRDALGLDDDGLGYLAGQKTITCFAIYTDQEMAVLVEGARWLKKPVTHGYGFRPLIYVVGPGAPYRSVLDNNEASTDTPTDDYIRYIGAGFLRVLKQTVADKQDMLSIQKTVAANTAQPPTAAIVPNGAEITKEQIPTQAGEVNVFPTGTVINPMPPPGQSTQQIGATLSVLQDAENRGGFGPAMFGQATGASGYQQTESVGTNIDVITPFAEMVRIFWQLTIRACMKVFARYGPPELVYSAVDRNTGMRTARNSLKPYEVAGADYRIKITLGDLGLHDKQAMGMLAANLVDRGIIDHETALSDYIHARNPTAIMKRARRDQAYKDPLIMRITALEEKMTDSTVSPLVKEVCAMALKQTVQQMVQEMSGQQGGANMAPMSPNRPPLPNQGAPGNILPDEALQNAGAGPNGVRIGPPQLGAGVPGL